MYQEKLTEIGLSKNQAEIYSLLISSGKQKGSEIAKKVGLSRQLTYKILDELIELELVEKKKESGKAGNFLTTHPSNLDNLLQKKENEIKKAQRELSVTIDSLISEYNLNSGKPGVQFFEGIDGVRKVLYDSLQNSEEIYAFIDFISIEKYVKKINAEYMQERIKKKVFKKILTVNNSETKKLLKNYSKDFTEIRLLPQNNNISFSVATEIYDNKISYITFKEKILTATKISDPEIYKLNKIIFEALWEKAEKI